MRFWEVLSTQHDCNSIKQLHPASRLLVNSLNRHKWHDEVTDIRPKPGLSYNGFRGTIDNFWFLQVAVFPSMAMPSLWGPPVWRETLSARVKWGRPKGTRGVREVDAWTSLVQLKFVWTNQGCHYFDLSTYLLNLCIFSTPVSPCALIGSHPFWEARVIYRICWVVALCAASSGWSAQFWGATWSRKGDRE